MTTAELTRFLATLGITMALRRPHRGMQTGMAIHRKWREIAGWIMDSRLRGNDDVGVVSFIFPAETEMGKVHFGFGRQWGRYFLAAASTYSILILAATVPM